MDMNCPRVESLLSEFADEKLDAGTAWLVQAHLSGCDACGKLHRELSAVRRMLQTLPAATPSTGFDAALAQRLALARLPVATPPTFRTKVVSFWTTQRLRPALALSLVLGVGAFAALFPAHVSTPPPSPAITVFHTADPAFVADCVAQHHRDAAAEPLADLSAQTLAGRLDSAPPENAPASTDTPADSSLQ